MKDQILFVTDVKNKEAWEQGQGSIETQFPNYDVVLVDSQRGLSKAIKDGSLNPSKIKVACINKTLDSFEGRKDVRGTQVVKYLQDEGFEGPSIRYGEFDWIEQYGPEAEIYTHLSSGTPRLTLDHIRLREIIRTTTCFSIRRYLGPFGVGHSISNYEVPRETTVGDVYDLLGAERLEEWDNFLGVQGTLTDRSQEMPRGKFYASRIKEGGIENLREYEINSKRIEKIVQGD